jgi:hypothetical protein
MNNFVEKSIKKKSEHIFKKKFYTLNSMLRFKTIVAETINMYK